MLTRLGAAVGFFREERQRVTVRLISYSRQPRASRPLLPGSGAGAGEGGSSRPAGGFTPPPPPPTHPPHPAQVVGAGRCTAGKLSRGPGRGDPHPRRHPWGDKVPPHPRDSGLVLTPAGAQRDGGGGGGGDPGQEKAGEGGGDSPPRSAQGEEWSTSPRRHLSGAEGREGEGGVRCVCVGAGGKAGPARRRGEEGRERRRRRRKVNAPGRSLQVCLVRCPGARGCLELQGSPPTPSPPRPARPPHPCARPCSSGSCGRPRRRAPRCGGG